MGRTVIVIIGVLASLMLADSLTCNQCKYGLLGFCLNNSPVACGTNTSVCFSAKTAFTDIANLGFNSQGCQEPLGCNATVNGTLVGINYKTTINCCATDKCNPTSAAPSTKMTLTAVIGVAAMASMWGSIM